MRLLWVKRLNNNLEEIYWGPTCNSLGTMYFMIHNKLDEIYNLRLTSEIDVLISSE